MKRSVSELKERIERNRRIIRNYETSKKRHLKIGLLNHAEYDQEMIDRHLDASRTMMRQLASRR